MFYKLIDNEPLEQRMTAKVPPRTDPHNPLYRSPVLM